jgi:hypothetical protein
MIPVLRQVVIRAANLRSAWGSPIGLVTLISLRGFPCRVVFDERIALERSMRVRTPHEPSSANHGDVDDLGFGKAS